MVLIPGASEKYFLFFGGFGQKNPLYSMTANFFDFVFTLNDSSDSRVVRTLDGKEKWGRGTELRSDSHRLQPHTHILMSSAVGYVSAFG